MVSWARAVAEEWTFLYKQAVLEPLSSDALFDSSVLGSELLWFVVFTDGVYCSQCRLVVSKAFEGRYRYVTDKLLRTFRMALRALQIRFRLQTLTLNTSKP